jgi:hypothetical protein
MQVAHAITVHGSRQNCRPLNGRWGPFLDAPAGCWSLRLPRFRETFNKSRERGIKHGHWRAAFGAIPLNESPERKALRSCSPVGSVCRPSARDEWICGPAPHGAGGQGLANAAYCGTSERLPGATAFVIGNRPLVERGGQERRAPPARQARRVASTQHGFTSTDYGRRNMPKRASALPRLDP